MTVIKTANSGSDVYLVSFWIKPEGSIYLKKETKKIYLTAKDQHGKAASIVRGLYKRDQVEIISVVYQ